MPKETEAVRAFRRLKDRERKYDLKVSYGVMFADQKGVCRICSSPPDIRPLSIDHCHVTGVVRGLLCGQCNSAVGLMGDDPKRLISAAKYLTKNHSTPKPPKRPSTRNQTSKKILADGTVKVYRYEKGVRVNP